MKSYNDGHGIVIDSTNVMVRGNREPLRIEENEALNWDVGIEGRGAAVVTKNQVTSNEVGIQAGGHVVGNVAT